MRISTEALRKVFGGWVLGAAVLSAPQGAWAQNPTGPRGMGDQGMSMDQCHNRMQAMDQRMDQMMEMMRKARQSNDPQEMRGALEKSEGALSDMRRHVSGCRDMMGQMQGMHGDMMHGHPEQKNME